MLSVSEVCALSYRQAFCFLDKMATPLPLAARGRGASLSSWLGEMPVTVAGRMKYEMGGNL